MQTIDYPQVNRRNFDGYYYEADEHDHAGIMFKKDGRWKLKTTDPYHELTYALGEEDDFICFEYMILEAHIALHAVVNSETGSFIDTFRYAVVRFQDAIKTAENMINDAFQWCADNDITPDLAGWSNSHNTFIVDLENELTRIEDAAGGTDG